MRIVHTADWHLGKNLNGNSRLEEQEAFLDFFVSKCEALRADLVIIAGDVYDAANPPAQAEELFYAALKKISRGGDCMSLVIAGNHDNPERLTAATPLAKEHGIIMLGTPKTIVPTGKYGNHELLNSGEGFLEIKINDETAIVAALPYLSEKRLAEVIYSIEDTEKEQSESYGAKVKEIFAKLSEHYRKDTINLAVAHIFALKEYKGTSERTATLGPSFLVEANAFPQNADYVALGHVHKPMVVSKENNIMYSGSPIHYSVDEISYDKKFLVIDAKAGEKPQIQEIDIPVFKPIVKWRCKSVQDAIEMCEKNREQDSWVYLEIETDSYIGDAEIKEMKSLKSDILDIQPIIKAKAEMLEVEKLSELSFVEQFQSFYKFRSGGAEPDEELMSLFEEILLKLEEGGEDETD